MWQSTGPTFQSWTVFLGRQELIIYIFNIQTLQGSDAYLSVALLNFNAPVQLCLMCKYHDGLHLQR